MVDRRWIVNPGSAGMPYGPTGVPWALLDRHGVQMRATPIDHRDLAERLTTDSAFPGIAAWVQDYVLNPPSATDAVTAFATGDGRTDAWNN